MIKQRTRFNTKMTFTSLEDSSCPVLAWIPDKRARCWQQKKNQLILYRFSTYFWYLTVAIYVILAQSQIAVMISQCSRLALPKLRCPSCSLWCDRIPFAAVLNGGRGWKNLSLYPSEINSTRKNNQVMKNKFIDFIS